MPSREAILAAVAGKGVERGLEYELTGEYCILRYTKPADEREDNLHKQSIRSLIGRIAPDWKIHIASMEDGFSVEVREKPSAIPKPAPNGEGTIPRMVDLTDAEKLKKMSDQLQEIANELASLV